MTKNVYMYFFLGLAVFNSEHFTIYLTMLAPQEQK